MGKSWSMDLTGHTPTFGEPPEKGVHLVEVSGVEPQSKKESGKNCNRIVFTYKVVTAGQSQGRIAKDYLAIIDDEFEGSDGYASVTRDKWVLLLRALGIKPGKVSDWRALAQKLEGKRLGLKIDHRKGQPQPGQAPEDVPTFADIKAYMSADAVTSASSLAVVTDADAEADVEADTSVEVSTDADTDDGDGDGEFDLSDIA